jgi:glutathione S-transferase
MSTPRIKLIGSPASRVMRNLWMLTELGLPYEHDPVGAYDPALKAPPYTQWNPNGRIPILLVDDFALWESLAINLYLERRFPSDISLTTLEDQAKGMQWALWVLSEMELASFDWYLNTHGKAEAERDAAVAAAAWEKLQRPLRTLETSLATGFLVGERFTVADLNTAATLYRGLWMPLENHPRTVAWLKQCWARPGGLAARRARGEAV